MVSGSIKDILKSWDSSQRGLELYSLVSALYPICRSITGDGFRKSLRLVAGKVPLVLNEVPTGTAVFDWTVPKEWNIRDAWIKNARGEKVLDFGKSNLHVLNYSVPIRATLKRDELKSRVFTLPDKPDWIPYRTSYYKETWGFCMTQRQWDGLGDGDYEICIDSSLDAGSLTYGEFLIQGETRDEVLISCHSCHPSLCNDNLSAMSAAASLAAILATVPLRYSYRFMWIPGTIGAITWLALNEPVIPRIRHGLVLSCVGDPGAFTYKRSRRGNAEIDRVVEHVLRSSEHPFESIEFSPYGYDERQYCSPGINLPMGCFMRTPNGKYPQYHTSADNLDLVTAPALAESLRMLLTVVGVLESNRRYVNLNPKCEPQLGRRGLYRTMGGTSGTGFEEALLWVLNQSDGTHSLLDIAERAKLNFGAVADAADALVTHDLLRETE
jgi:aminopeptidase-like protein